MDEQATTEMGLFLSALEIQKREKRREFLDEACRDDRRLRGEIDALLDAHDRLPPDDDAGTPDYEISEAQAGSVIGCYRLLEHIGEGGMAVVFLAEQTQPIVRKVALKLVKPGMDSRQIVARFQAERQALAMMDHPNIAKVLEAGTTDHGRPYFVMELVKGVPITKYCDERQLSPRERLESFVHVCHAVQHAHQKGIIHRDIKPTNVLIAPYDGKPVPKVIDFGIAKAIGQQLTERTMFTGLGAIVGTLEYMSPEQAELNQLDIDTRSDIYSLGVLLYELLTGTTPLERDRLKWTALDEVLRTIRQEEPPKPSTRLSAMSAEALPLVAAQRALDPKKLTSVVHGELDWIVMKSLEKDRGRRYQTAIALASDVERYLHGDVVLACPPSASYRLRKFARRHATGLVATAAAFAGLLTLVVILVISNTRVARERNDKAAALLDAQAQRDEKATALRDAQAQRERAERNFLNARTAVAKLMAQPATGLKEWSALPMPLRKKFAEEAIKYYNSLLQEGTAGVDPSIRYETAVGYRSIGFLHQRFGEHAEALKLAGQSIEILEGLNKEDPKNRDYRQQLAWTRMMRGWNLNLLNRPAEAEAAFLTAAPLLEQLISENPKLASYTTELFECYRGVNKACTTQWAALSREEFRRRATSLPAALSADLPHACLVYDRVAWALGAAGFVDDALGMHREALARSERMKDYPISEQDYRSLRQDLRTGLAETLVTGKRSAEAIEMIEGDVAAAPDNALLQHMLGHLRARLGQWDQAAAAYAKCLDLKPEDWEPWYCAAGVYLARGDVEGYRRASRGMLKQFTKPSIPVEAGEPTIRTCAVMPEAVADFAAVDQLADRLIAAVKDAASPGQLLAKGLVDCRAGRYAEAIRWLGRVKADANSGAIDATALAALAVAHHQLGDRDAANAALDKAEAIIDQKMPDPAKGQPFPGTTYVDWQHCLALCREAQTLLAEPSDPNESR